VKDKQLPNKSASTASRSLATALRMARLLTGNPQFSVLLFSSHSGLPLPPTTFD
jgi:hypothetical protein